MTREISRARIGSPVTVPLSCAILRAGETHGAEMLADNTGGVRKAANASAPTAGTARRGFDCPGFRTTRVGSPAWRASRNGWNAPRRRSPWTRPQPELISDASQRVPACVPSPSHQCRAPRWRTDTVQIPRELSLHDLARSEWRENRRCREAAPHVNRRRLFATRDGEWTNRRERA